MHGNKSECNDVKAEKFQRLVLGGLLFIAYILHYSPIVIFVAIIMATSILFTVKSAPFYQLYVRISKSRFSLAATCDCDCQGNRFACSLGFVFLGLSLLLFHLGKATAAWVLVLFVGTLSVISGTVGFCLATALYVVLFQRAKK